MFIASAPSLSHKTWPFTEYAMDLDLKKRQSFSNLFWPLLKRALFFEIAGAGATTRTKPPQL
jgi:hypothetical protein